MLFSQKELFAAVNTHHTAVSDVLMYGATWMGTGQVVTASLLFLMVLRPFRNLRYFVFAALCNIVPFITQQLLKTYFDCPRPLNYFHHASWIHIQPWWPELYHRSFPSGHSEGSFSFFCFLSLLLPAKYHRFGALFFVLAITVCYSRLYLAAHFFEDAYAGSIIGVTLTTLVYSVVSRYQHVFTRKQA